MRANGVGQRRQGGHSAVIRCAGNEQGNGEPWQCVDGTCGGTAICCNAVAMHGIASALRTDAAAEQCEAWHTDGNAPQGIAAALLRKATRWDCVARHGHGIEKPSAAGGRHWLAWPRLSVAERRGGKGMQGRGRARPRWARRRQGIAPLRSAGDLRRAHREAWRWQSQASHGGAEQGRGKAGHGVAWAWRWIAWRRQSDEAQGDGIPGRRRAWLGHGFPSGCGGKAKPSVGVAQHDVARAEQGETLRGQSEARRGNGTASGIAARAKHRAAAALRGLA